MQHRQQRFQIFHPTISLSHKNFLFEKILMTSFHVICSFGLLQSKTLGTPRNWRSPEKNFWRPFFLENACACVLGPWPRAFLSLASRVSVLGKAVLGLGLGFFLCPWPWPWPRALCPRLHICLTPLDHISHVFRAPFESTRFLTFESQLQKLSRSVLFLLASPKHVKILHFGVKFCK